MFGSNLYERPKGVETRWFSYECRSSQRAQAGLENQGAKGHAFDAIHAGETAVLADVSGSGLVCRIWLTVDDRSPEMLRSLRLEMFWDGEERPAVSVPLGDFFGIGLGRRVAFECALFSDPEGRSFNCLVPMPFRTGARIQITNESDKDLAHLFYDVDMLLGVQHPPEALYFHAGWRRERPNRLGKEFQILPHVKGSGRFLGTNVGVIADLAYQATWWGEGEVKVRFGDDLNATLCGTGTEDYIGTGWGQGTFANRTQGCPIADTENRQWAFYRYHLDDPIYFEDGCSVAIQTIGGAGVKEVKELIAKGVPISPVSLDYPQAGGFVKLLEPGAPEELPEDGWCNFWRQDDWSATAYLYLDTPDGVLPPLAPVTERI